MPASKIATCCYCGTRAALVLTGERRHELACSSCGAPLHDLKRLKTGAAPAPAPARLTGRPVQDRHYGGEGPRGEALRGRKKRRVKSFGRRALEEIWDVIEDIID
jgi:hypothetical protein